MDKFITITVITTGDDLEERFNLAQPLKVVFNRALVEVGGQPDREQFTLEYQDRELDLEDTIGDAAEQLGWGEAVILELVPRPVVVS